MLDESTVERALRYAAANSIILIEPPLGFGDDGAVWATNRRTALKAFHRESNYAHELECYQRLTDAGITSIREFAVPELTSYDDQFWIIEMGFVSPPYILDFGK